MIRLTIVIVTLLLLTGCKSHERLVTATTSDTVYLTKYSHDSIHITDSIYVHEYMRGDTVYVDRDRWRTQYKDRTEHDTIYISHDNVVTVKEEKKLPLWKEIMIYYSLFVVVALLAIIVVLYLYIRYLLRENEKK